MKKTLPLFLKNKMILLLLLLNSSFLSLHAQTNTFTGPTGGNWSVPGNWSLGLTPILAHDVIIPNNINVIIDLPSAVCNKLTINTGANGNEVIVGANTLTVAGAITINIPTVDNINKIVSVTSGILNCGSIVMGNSGTALRDCRVVVTSGVLNVTGNITMGGSVNENQIILDGTTTGGTLNMGGNFTGTGGDLVSGAYATVNFNGAAVQTIPMFGYFQYNNVIINNAAGATLGANVTTLTVSGDITVQSGILNSGGRTIVLNSGKTFSVGNGAKFNTTTATTFSSPLPLMDLGATSTIEYKGGSQTVVDVPAPGYGHLIVSGSGTKTSTGDLDVQGDLTVQSATLANGGFAIKGNPTNVFSVANGAFFLLTGVSSFPVGFGTNTLGVTSTVKYTGGNQTIFDVAAPGYGHLSITASVKTVAGDLDIQGDLSVTSGKLINGGFAITGNSLNTFTVANAVTIEIGGTTSAFPSGFGTNTLGATSIVDYNGTGDQTIFDVASPGYGHLKASTSGIKTATSDLEIRGDLTIGANATFATSTFMNSILGNIVNNGVVAVASGIVNVTGNWTNNTTGTVTLDSGVINTTGYYRNYGVITMLSGEVNIMGYFTNYSTGSVLATSGLINLTGNWANNTSGKISLGSAMVNLMGNWLNSGIFNAGTSTVNFNSNIIGKTITGTITGASGKFYNLAFNGVGGGWVASSLDVANSLSVTNGNVTMSGILTVAGTAAVTVATGAGLTLGNNASLIQSGYTGVNSGNINVIRNTTPVILNDFTYWSSPTTGAQTILNFSPTTRTDRIFTYHNQWSSTSPATQTFVKGVGYAISAPQGTSSTVPVILAHQFTGVPTNGNVDVVVAVGPPISNRLIGNPYPSALNANAFINANRIGSGTINQTISGTLYFWTHNHGLAGNVYSASDYATYTLVGGTKVATGTGNLNKPTSYITSGQGFFIQTVANGNVSFRNDMRIGGVVANNANFYKTANATTSDITLESHRIWLNLTNSNASNFSQALIGYIETATNESDSGLDGLYYGTNQHVIYSLINNDTYTIQGRAFPFVDTDIVPLGYKTNTAGNTTISIDEVDGLFSDTQNIYLEDQLLNVIHNLKLAPYTFSSQAGTFNSRFVLRYTNVTLGNDDFDVLKNNIIVASGNQVIHIKSQLEPLKNIMVYDVLGRLIFEKNNVNTTEFMIRNLVLNQQALIVKVVLENGRTISRKIIF